MTQRNLSDHHEVMSTPDIRDRTSVDALVRDLRALADAWEQHSNDVSKFIDAEHAQDLRAVLDKHTSTSDEREALARRIEARPVIGPTGAQEVAERAALVRATGSPLHDYEHRSLQAALWIVQEALEAVADVDVVDTTIEELTIDVDFDPSRFVALPSGRYRVALVRESDERW